MNTPRFFRASHLFALAALSLGACAASGESDDGEADRGGSAGDSGGLNQDGESTLDELPEGCATEIISAENVPVDIYLLMDHSQSMVIMAWDFSVDALSRFVKLPDLEGLSMGIGFFPLAPVATPTCGVDADCAPYEGPCTLGKCKGGKEIIDSCDAADYSTPQVPIGQLPAVGASIEAAMNAQSPDGNTPMAPALDGALTYATQWAQQNPSHVTVIALATDGMPSVCAEEEIEDVAAIAAAGAAQSPPVKTFVVGFGMGPALEAIATAGGTEVVDVAVGNADEEFLAALQTIRELGDCRFQLPVPPAGETLDLQTVNVGYHDPVEGTEVLAQVSGESDCGAGSGWYYANGNTGDQIVLCPDSCTELKDERGAVEIVVGCATVVR